MVSAWASRQRLVLGQEATDVKSNEITAIPLLLRRLELTAYMRDVLDIDVTGGKTSSINAIKKQISALAACTMQIGAWDGEKSFLLDTKPFELISVWLPLEDKQRSFWPNTIT